MAHPNLAAEARSEPRRGQFHGAPALLPEVLLWFSDFFGYATANLPAAWRYGNALLTSVHPEADNCTRFDCPVAGTIPHDSILRNRAWLATHVNTIAGTSFAIPDVPFAPSFDTSAPHDGFPTPACAAADGSVLFCDGFDSDAGVVPPGLWQWQRNQTMCVDRRSRAREDSSCV